MKTELKTRLYEIIDILGISIHKELYYTFDDKKFINKGPLNTHSLLTKFDKGEINVNTKIRFLDILSYNNLEQEYFYIHDIINDDNFVLNIHPSTLYFYILEKNMNE